MALQLYMLGLVVHDMSKALAFYRRLGLAIPDGSDNSTHVGVKMDSGLTLFLDSRPAAWEGQRDQEAPPAPDAALERPRVVLEFYLASRAEVESKYAELTGAGYAGHRAPFETSFGMYFAMIHDPDGNTVLLSAS